MAKDIGQFKCVVVALHVLLRKQVPEAVRMHIGLVYFGCTGDAFHPSPDGRFVEPEDLTGLDPVFPTVALEFPGEFFRQDDVAVLAFVSDMDVERILDGFNCEEIQLADAYAGSGDDLHDVVDIVIPKSFSEAKEPIIVRFTDHAFQTALLLLLDFLNGEFFGPDPLKVLIDGCDDQIDGSRFILRLHERSLELDHVFLRYWLIVVNVINETPDVGLVRRYGSIGSLKVCNLVDKLFEAFNKVTLIHSLVTWHDSDGNDRASEDLIDITAPSHN